MRRTRGGAPCEERVRPMRDDAAIERAMREHGDVIWRVCLLRMGQRADAQDAFQETFFKFAAHDEVTFASAEHERAWLIRVATNQCLDTLRSAAYATSSIDDESIPEPSIEPDAAPGSDQWEAMQALNGLPPEQRQAIYLTACEGYPATEVATMMGVPANTVYSWVARGKKKLREVLG